MSTEVEALAATVRAGLDEAEALAQRLAERHVRPESPLIRPEFWGERFWPTPHVARVFYDLKRSDRQGRDLVLAEGLALIEMFSPWRVLDQTAALRGLVDDLLAWPHDGYCAAVAGGPCGCGRDLRVAGLLRRLAAAWTQEDQG